MAAQFVDRRVMEGFDGGLLDSAHHPFGLAVGPWVIGLGEPMLDAVCLADAAEDMADPSQRPALVTLNKLYAVVGQDGVDPVGHRLDQHAQEGCRGERGRPPLDAGKNQL